MKSVQGATKALCLWHIAKEQHRNALKMGLPKGPGRFWATTMSLIVCVALLRNTLCSLSRCKITSGKWLILLFSTPLWVISGHFSSLLKIVSRLCLLRDDQASFLRFGAELLLHRLQFLLPLLHGADALYWLQ